METFFSAYARELVILAMIWVLPWKGVAMWYAARNGHKKWFIALLVINSLAILDILYIFIFSRKMGRIPQGTVEVKVEVK